MKSILFIGADYPRATQHLLARGHRVDQIDLARVDSSRDDVGRYDAIVGIDINLALNDARADLYLDLLRRAGAGASIVFWTHEPFWDSSRQGYAIEFGRGVRRCSVYTNDVYLSPYSHYFGVGGYLWTNRFTSLDLPARDVLRERFDSGRKKQALICAYASCFNDARLHFPHSLVRFRNDCIKIAFDAGMCAVHGKGWREPWAVDVVEESRSGGTAENGERESWGLIKVRKSRRDYSFSICIENCLYPNFVTEKFGQAIESWLVPIYVRGSGIEDVMDASAALLIEPSIGGFKSALQAAIDMSFDEYFERVRELVNAYNRVIANVAFVNDERLKPGKMLADYVAGI